MSPRAGPTRRRWPGSLTSCIPGARLYALLDGGIDPETERTKILARFGDRVTVKVLAITEIEGAYTESAVARWIVANGGDPDRATGFAAQAAGGKAKKALTKLTFDGWHRTYKVVEDGAAIADCMSVGEIDPEIGEWLRTLAADN